MGNRLFGRLAGTGRPVLFDVTNRLAGRWDRDWMLGFRDICRSTDERTMICGFFPISAVGNNLPILLSTAQSPELLGAILSSFALDYVARMNVGSVHMHFFIAEQLPVLSPARFLESCAWQTESSYADWIKERLVELTYDTAVLEGLGRECGATGGPYFWDPDRRVQIRAEIDACLFTMYGLSHSDVSYVLDTFPIVQRNDEKELGEYRTKRLILAAFEAMATGLYRSPLSPPPGVGLQHA